MDGSGSSLGLSQCRASEMDASDGQDQRTLCWGFKPVTLLHPEHKPAHGAALFPAASMCWKCLGEAGFSRVPHGCPRPGPGLSALQLLSAPPALTSIFWFCLLSLDSGKEDTGLGGEGNRTAVKKVLLLLFHLPLLFYSSLILIFMSTDRFLWHFPPSRLQLLFLPGCTCKHCARGRGVL